MQKIINELKLDFDDVLIVPQRSTLTSRSEIKLERTFYFYHSPRIWNGIPIMCANMSFCSFNMAKALADHKMIACLHKYHSVKDLTNYFTDNPENIDYTFVSIGYKKSDLNHLLELKEKLGKQPNIFTVLSDFIGRVTVFFTRPYPVFLPPGNRFVNTTNIDITNTAFRQAVPGTDYV